MKRNRRQIELTIVGDQVKVVSPYNAVFVQKARNLRGEWKEDAWWFDDSILEYVREMMLEIFGTTGEEAYEECTLLIKDYTKRADRGPVVLFGRTIAKAWGRDSGAKLSDDIVFILGKYSSGGSMKNWTTDVVDATFEIRNFPKPSLELPDVKAAIEAGWCIVKEAKKKKRDREEILSEIASLKERIELLRKELDE